MNRLLAAGALAAFLVAGLVIALTSLSSGDGSKPAQTTTATTRTRPAKPPPTTTSAPKAAAVKLIGIGAYDPEGDGRENGDLARLATDGDPATYWKTEHYTHGFFKKGVGLVLDAGRSVRLARVVVATDRAGASAQIRIGNDPTGPFRAVSPVRPLNGRTAFPAAKGAAGRYIVVWITAISPAIGEAHVTEVHATAFPPRS